MLSCLMHACWLSNDAWHSEKPLHLQGDNTHALEEWIELANGCLCCSVKSDFLLALETLMQQRSRFDYILIETTGA